MARSGYDWEGMAKFCGYTCEREMLQDMYIDKQLSFPQIAERLDVSWIAVRARVIKANMHIRPRGGRNYGYESRRTLFRLDQRIVMCYPWEHIANISQVSIPTVKYYHRLVKGEEWDAIRRDKSNDRLEALFELIQLPPTAAPSKCTSLLEFLQGDETEG